MSKKTKHARTSTGKMKRGGQVLSDHRRHKKTLLPPLAQFQNFQLLDWEGFGIPEHLWLAYLMRNRTISEAAVLFNAACDIIDTCWPSDRNDVFLGYISDFGHVPLEKRANLREQLLADNEASAAFRDDFRVAMGLYPTGPAGWLGATAESPQEGLALLRPLVTSLRQARSQPTIHARVLGLNRLFKHNRISIAPEIAARGNLADGLASYPNTDEATTARVEQFARTTLNMMLMSQRQPDWGREFWRANFSFVGCR